MDDKPKPSSDIWEKLEVEFRKTQPPKDAITVSDYMNHFKAQSTNMTRDIAYKKLLKLEAEGKVKCVGKFGRFCELYYVWIK